MKPLCSGCTLSTLGQKLLQCAFTREKSFLICRDRRLAVHFQTQWCVARSDLSAESDRGTVELQDSALQSDIWGGGGRTRSDRYINGEIISANDKEVISCSFACMGSRGRVGGWSLMCNIKGTHWIFSISAPRLGLLWDQQIASAVVCGSIIAAAQKR